MFRYDDEDYRNQLGDKYDAFSQELNQINGRMLPMDVGPNSNNAKYSKQQQADRDALFQRYGVKPTAPNPDIISKLRNGSLVQNKLVNGAVQQPPVNRQSGVVKPIPKNVVGNKPIRFDELRNRFKK